MSRMRYRSLRLLELVIVLCLGGAASSAIATPPSVRNVNVRGLQIGGTTTLVIDGTDLLPNPRLVMAVPIATQVVRPNATATRVEIDVTLDGSASPGLNNLYLANDGGISEKTLVALDRLPQRPFAPTIDSLPVALHGTLGGSATLRTSFAGKATQPLIFEIESQRLGAKLRPVLHLYAADGRHIAWSLPSPALRGDTRLVTTLPADGQYTLTLNDLQFAAPAPNHFRLKIGQWQYADFAFPSAIQRGSSPALQLIGNVPANKLAAVVGLETSHRRAAWPDADLSSGPTPAVMISDLPEWLEVSAGKTPQEIPSIPSAVNGRIATAGEEDRYRLKVQPESKLKFELFSARLGAPVDGVLELRRDNGAVLATNDDSPGTTDSLLEFTVPKDVESVIVAVKDVHGRGGETAIYRLVVTAPSATPARKDFQLSIDQDRFNVPQAGRQVLKVRVDRRGYAGPIHVEFDKLPPGVTVEGADIEANSTGKLVTLVGAGEVLGQFLTSIRGRATGELLQQPVTRVARSEPDPVAQFQPWLADDVVVALASRAGNAFDGEWQPATDSKLVLGGKLQAPVKCVRPVGFDGPVRLTLLTSQIPPQVNGANDPNRTVRPESATPVEIPPDAKAQAAWDAKLAADKLLADAQVAQVAAAKAVTDAQTAGGAALEAATKAKADVDARVKDAELKRTAAAAEANTASAAAKNDINYVVLVPSDLPMAPVELTFRAELLSRDKQRVLMTVCTPVRPVPVVNPLKLQYAGPPKQSAKIDPKAGVSVKVAGKVERLEGLTGDVTVSVVGLPAGVPVPKLVVKADQSDYELEFKFPANSPPGELKDIKLFATGKMVPTAPLEIRSAEVGVTVELLPPDADEKK
jgi:hypothetical protein